MGNKCIKINSIQGLRKGDHISYKNGFFYHHGIVIDLDPQENTITVLHFIDNTVGTRNDGLLDHPAVSYAKVREEVIDVGLYVSKDKLYRYLYEDHECGSVDDVVARAKAHLMKSKFNVQYTNCKDFAVRCKTIETLLSGIARGA